MAKTKRRYTCEEVLEDCEKQLKRQRCGRKELRKELEKEKVKWLGTIDWSDLTY